MAEVESVKRVQLTAWTQGHYGRFAAHLIARGAISREGVILMDASGGPL